MPSYFSRFYNRLPNTSKYFTTRYWRNNRKGYNSGPTVFSNEPIKTGYDQISTAQPTPQKIVNILWNYYISISRKRTKMKQTIEEFQKGIKQKYTCNNEGTKNDFVVNADIDTNNKNGNDWNTNWFLTMNEYESTPTLRENCIPIIKNQKIFVGGKKHKKTQNKRSKNKSKTQKITRTRK